MERYSGLKFIGLALLMLCLFSTPSANEQEHECDEKCTDFNWKCFSLPRNTKPEDIPQCQNALKDRCPLTCGQCRKCNYVDEAQYVGLLKRVENLERFIDQQEAEIAIKNSISGKIYQNKELYVSAHLYDGNENTQIVNGGCFITERTDGDRWVALFLEQNHLISTVKILNRASSEQRIKGSTVKVCKDYSLSEESCKTFGTVNEGPKSAWIQVHPVGGAIVGNIIKIEQPAEEINICEVKVFGKTLLHQLEGMENKLNIVDSKSGAIWQNNPNMYGADHLYDGNWDTEIERGGCFVSQPDDDERWVALVLEKQQPIRQVRILNRVNAEWRINGATVSVCGDDSMENCEKFGTVEGKPNGGWVLVNPENKEAAIEGKVVRIEQASEHVNICEVMVMGK